MMENSEDPYKIKFLDILKTFNMKLLIKSSIPDFYGHYKMKTKYISIQMGYFVLDVGVIHGSDKCPFYYSSDGHATVTVRKTVCVCRIALHLSQF